MAVYGESGVAAVTTLDLRQFFAWCGRRGVRLFDLHRAEIELFARELEELGRARATIGRRLSTVVGFYRYAEEEGLIEHSPAVHVRRPRLDYESHAVGLDRNELGAFLVAAGLASARDHALACLLALNGLRISEALGADIDALGLERGHRTLRVHRKGTRLSPSRWRPARPGRSIWPPASWLDGPIFLDAHGARLRRDGAARILRRLARRAGIAKRIGPHSLRHSFITAAQLGGVAADATFSRWRERGLTGEWLTRATA